MNYSSHFVRGVFRLRTCSCSNVNTLRGQGSPLPGENSLTSRSTELQHQQLLYDSGFSLWELIDSCCNALHHRNNCFQIVDCNRWYLIHPCLCCEDLTSSLCFSGGQLALWHRSAQAHQASPDRLVGGLVGVGLVASRTSCDMTISMAGWLGPMKTYMHLIATAQAQLSRRECLHKTC